jgi:predicted phage-related endonuclease
MESTQNKNWPWLVLGGNMSIETDYQVKDFDQDAANWVEFYRQTQAQIKELQEKADYARANIEQALGMCEVGTFNNRPIVRWTTVKTSRLDVNKVKEALSPELVEQFSTVTTSRRFVLVTEE